MVAFDAYAAGFNRCVRGAPDGYNVAKRANVAAVIVECFFTAAGGCTSP